GTPADAACQAASLPARPPPMMGTRDIREEMCLLRGGFRPLLGAPVRAVLLVADQLTAVPFGDLLDKERRAAVGTLLGQRLVPEGEVAVRVVGAAVEHLPAPGLFFAEGPPRFAAQPTGRLLFHVLAVGIVGAGRELPKTSLLDDQVRLALRAFLVEDLIRLGGGHALLGGDDLPRGLALGIAGAREELSEPPALDGHRLAAVLARFLW